MKKKRQRLPFNVNYINFATDRQNAKRLYPYNNSRTTPMKNVYHREIMEALLPCGADGMRICNLARKIYNQHTNLFVCDINYHELYKCISRYLWAQSQLHRSPFKHCKRGYYAIKSNVAVQLDIFIHIPTEEHTSTHAKEVRKSANTTQLTFDF